MTPKPVATRSTASKEKDKQIARLGKASPAKRKIPIEDGKEILWTPSQGDESEASSATDPDEVMEVSAPTGKALLASDGRTKCRKKNPILLTTVPTKSSMVFMPYHPKNYEIQKRKEIVLYMSYIRTLCTYWAS